MVWGVRVLRKAADEVSHPGGGLTRILGQSIGEPAKRSSQPAPRFDQRPAVPARIWSGFLAVFVERDCTAASSSEPAYQL
jgi:hypothetical protein